MKRTPGELGDDASAGTQPTVAADGAPSLGTQPTVAVAGAPSLGTQPTVAVDGEADVDGGLGEAATVADPASGSGGSGASGAPGSSRRGVGASSATPPGDDSSPSARGTVTVAPGVTLGRYAVLDELGAGGMASVFRARDAQLRREVAIKVMFPHLARKPEVARRFQREARAAAGLEHPNILRVYDVGGGRVPGSTLDEPPYIVMELVRGQSLRELLERTGPLLAEVVACVGALLCDALAAAHDAGIVHRDVKPANVMVTDDGRLLLADFGVARVDDDESLVTRTGALLGTPAYMSPEQARGDDVDGRSDVYSVGATLYQLATGAVPFAGSTAMVIAAIGRGEFAPAARRRPEVGGELSRAIDAMMAQDPARRPVDARAAAAALRDLAEAGGFGDARGELAAFLADPPAFEAARRPRVVEALLTAAERAVADGALPRALSQLDRVLALAPDHAGAQRLAARLARRGAARRWLAVAGGAVAVAVVGGGAWMAIGGDAATSGGSPGDPPVAAVVVDAGAAPVGDAEPRAAEPPVDAGGLAVAGAGVPDAGRPGGDAGVSGGPRRPVPGRERTGAPMVAPPPDAGPSAVVQAVVAPDAAPARAAAPPDARPEPATLAVQLDTWCDLTIDGVSVGRADRKRRYPVEPGRRELACTQGQGMPSWREVVDVRPGEHRVVTGALLGDVRVTVDVETGDGVTVGGRAVRDGGVVALSPGRVRVEITRGGEVVASGWVSLPRVEACTLRDRPDLDCYTR